MTGSASHPDSGLILRGELRLGARLDEVQGKTVATRQFHRGALSVMRPLYLDDSGQMSMFILNPGGGYVSGDDYLIEVTVEDGAELLLTTQSATKVYRTTGLPARQRLSARIGDRGVLEYLPDQLIVYRDGRYLQDCAIELAPTGHLVLAEITTAGWSPDDTDFSFEEIRTRCAISVRDEEGSARPLCVDHLRLVPADFGFEVGIMDGFTHCGQLLLVDRRIDDELVTALHSLADDSPCRVGISVTGAQFRCADGELAPRCLSMRSLGNSTPEIAALHTKAASLIRSRLTGRPDVNLRKY